MRIGGQRVGRPSHPADRDASDAWYRDIVAIHESKPTRTAISGPSALHPRPVAGLEADGVGWTGLPAAPSTRATPPSTRATPPIAATWLARVPYPSAWALQKRLAAERAAGLIGDRLLLLEHEPVLTLGRHADPSHVLVPPEVLTERGIDLVRVERGGEVTYHGPGQLVAYPIVALGVRGLGIRTFVRILETALAETCAAFGVEAGPRPGHPGCWCDPEGPLPRKVGALGLRVERGVTYHGVALNIDLDLAPFDLINPCGLPGLRSTSVAAELARAGRSEARPSVVEAAWHFARALADGLEAELVLEPANVGRLGADGEADGADPRAERIGSGAGSSGEAPVVPAEAPVVRGEGAALRAQDD